MGLPPKAALNHFGPLPCRQGVHRSFSPLPRESPGVLPANNSLILLRESESKIRTQACEMSDHGPLKA